jgi:serine/threonine protein kinase
VFLAERKLPVSRPMTRVASTIKRFLERPDGERRLGPFLLVKQLGRGGFAPVWLAKEVYGTAVVRTAAVKLFALRRDRRSAGQREIADEARAKIIAEASALCKVAHPNVVRFYSLPIDEESGLMGLAMEHIDGAALEQRIAQLARLSVGEALAVGIAIASALAAVHRAGLVHRDVKPSNVIESLDGYKLIDFGIAAADILSAPESLSSAPEVLDELPLEITRPARRAGSGHTTMALGGQSGTRGYIDPVCVTEREPATPASDLYSLGATLFQCLTGEVPAAAAAPRGRGLDEDVLEGFATAPPLLTIAPEVPSLLGQVIDALLAPERSKRPPSAGWVATRLAQIRSELAAQNHAIPPEEIGPFRGLGRFEERDRHVYFGRDSEIARALKRLRSRGLVTIAGSSGSGKSSLARAGVLPAITERGLGEWPAQWDAVVTEPGRDPRAAVTLALEPFVAGAAAMTPDALLLALAVRAQKEGRGLLLLVDQLEQLAAVDPGESQTWTAELLVGVEQKVPAGVRVLAAARRDLLDPLLTIGGLGESLTPGLLLIKPIADHQIWGDILDQALATYGYTFEDDALRSEVLAELEGTASAMPLVQFALTELWRKRDPDAKQVTRAGLRAIGGIAGALERHANATLDALARAHVGGEEAARTVLLLLTTAQGTSSTRKLADLQREGGLAAGSAIAALEEARLIVRGAHGVTLAHEALLTQWRKLRTWVGEARQDRLLAEEIERDSEQWRGDPEAVPLWPSRRLALGEELQKRGSQRLSATAVRFLKASRWAALRGWLIVLGSAAMVALSLLGFGYTYVRAEQKSRMAAEEQTRALAEKQLKINALIVQLNQAKDATTRAKIEQQILEEDDRTKRQLPVALPTVVVVRAPSGPGVRSAPTATPSAVAPAPLAVLTLPAAPAPAPAPIPVSTVLPSVSSFPENPTAP